MNHITKNKPRRQRGAQEAHAEQQCQQFIVEVAAVQAEQQRYREEAAARLAAREEAERLAALAEYAARTCP